MATRLCYGSNLELLRTAIPWFVDALPPHPGIAYLASALRPQNAVSEATKDAITLLRFEIKEMRNILMEDRTEKELSAEETTKVAGAIEAVLLIFEDLLDPALLNHRSTPTSPFFPRLTVLKDWSRNDTSTISDRLKSISYGNDEVNFRRIFTAVQDLNGILRSIYCPQSVATGNFNRQVFHQEHGSVHNEDETAAKEIHRAQILSDTARTVIHLLGKPSSPCGTEHTALIHLTGFSRPEIEMILSVCGPGNREKWHLVSWDRNIQQESSSTPTSAETICAVLRSSWKRKKRLRINVDQADGWSTVPTVHASDRMECNIREPKVTLKDLLHGRRDQERYRMLKRLLKWEKLDLAVAIARSLLYLLGSPLRFDTWEAENIYIEQTMDKLSSGGLGFTQPYIRHELGREDGSKDAPAQSEDRRMFILRLGALIWELLFGHRINITAEDEECEPENDTEDAELSLFNALNREEINARETFVEKPFLDIIANCLNVYTQENLDEPDFRSDIYWKIVKPLEDYRKAYRSPLDQHAQSQPITGVPSRSHPKRSASPSFHHTKRSRYDSMGFPQDLEPLQEVSSPDATPQQWGVPNGFYNIDNIHPHPQTVRKEHTSPYSPYEPSTPPEPHLTVSDYTVSILCALSKELRPIRILFDRKHPYPEVPLQDTNSYTFGQMGSHNIVAACLPSGQYGSNAAAHVISHMERTFPALRFCLLVGIGAGIPTPQNNIWLGDVVVSHPTGSFPGVIQHDQQKVFDNLKPQRTGSLRGPPSFLLRHISNLTSDPEVSPETLLQRYIDEIASGRQEYQYPGVENDRLFKSDYIHNAEDRTCERCADTEEVSREHRTTIHPRVHYGLIASGDQVIKSAQARDELGLKYNTIMLEVDIRSNQHDIDAIFNMKGLAIHNPMNVTFPDKSPTVIIHLP
ncbi:hypothetical protein FE257_003927 [Aspergillus nanangensis]|uniref:DUF7580 domain-containing protein n=1 Tax=Aspergillus nanangensis TaxID=2582783 RepID=A0AAD4GW42_ASPNN|nr:hypothetical protein FE257_003927 [Aspergillus nanangensis]